MAASMHQMNSFYAGEITTLIREEALSITAKQKTAKQQASSNKLVMTSEKQPGI